MQAFQRFGIVVLLWAVAMLWQGGCGPNGDCNSDSECTTGFNCQLVEGTKRCIRPACVPACVAGQECILSRCVQTEPAPQLQFQVVGRIGIREPDLLVAVDLNFPLADFQSLAWIRRPDADKTLGVDEQRLVGAYRATHDNQAAEKRHQAQDQALCRTVVAPGLAGNPGRTLCGFERARSSPYGS